MGSQPTNDKRDFSEPWIADDIAHIDEQIQLSDLVRSLGKTTLTIDLPNYISLQRYTRELLLHLDAVLRNLKVAEACVRSNQVADALRSLKRRRGRPPRSYKTGLFAGLPVPKLARKTNKGGRPRTLPDKFLPKLNDAVEAFWAKKYGDNKRIVLKKALYEFLCDIGELAGIDPQKTSDGWYKPLDKYRTQGGSRLYRKSQNPAHKSHDFGPLLSILGRPQTASSAHKRSATPRGRNAHQTRSTARRK